MANRYVWSKYSVNSSTTYKAYISANGDPGYLGVGISQVYSSYGVDSSGNFTLLNPLDGSKYTSSTVWGYGWAYVSGKNTLYGGNFSYRVEEDWLGETSKYWAASDLNTQKYDYGVTSSLVYSKGTTSYGNISAPSSSAYPSNSYSGSYWYVYQGYDCIDPSAVSYSTSLPKIGESVKITATPRSNTYGGTIKYKYEYTTNGSTWTTANSGTTATSVNVTIPTGATKFQARVTASDDMGFTSTTAVTGSDLIVYDINPTAVSYDIDQLVAGDELTLTITPNTSGYTNTITYVVQTNVDGTGWETATESTSTNIPLTIPNDAVSWAVRVYAKTSDFTSSVYVYGNDTSEGSEVKHGVGFNIIPENKYLGYLGSAELMQYYVSTEDNLNYICTISLDGNLIFSTSLTPGMQTLTIENTEWEALSITDEHTIMITATCNGKSLSRTYTFNKFVYDPSTLPGLLDGIAEAIKLKMGVNRSLYGYRLPMEILKITKLDDDYITAYIDITASYVDGMRIVAIAESGEVYSAAADSSGTTRLEVSEKGDYIVQAKIGDIASESKKVSISADGDIGSASVSFIKLKVTTSIGATVTATLGTQNISTTAASSEITIYMPSKGTWTITAVSGENSTTKTVEITAYETYTVEVLLYDPILENNSWAQIQAAAKRGIASSLWNVGDKKAIELNGIVGSLTFSSDVYYAFILGFDHNSTYEGNNSIHFQFGKNASGTDIAFVDSNYNSSGSTAGFRMNTSNTNSGGWASSYMRQTICAAFLAAMPTEWQNVIVACTKYSDNTGGGSDTASYVTATQDKIWLLAEFEVFGTRSYANSAEQNYQKQYDYYANGNSRMKYKHSDTATTCIWWLRSVDAANSVGFRDVNAGGSNSGTNVYYSNGFAPAFVIG